MLFVLVGDDPKWAKDNLGRWAKQGGDLYFAGQGGIDDHKR